MADGESRYQSGTDMWQEYKARYGVSEAHGICNRYLDMQVQNNDPEEQQFCRELYSAMQGDPLLMPVTAERKASVLGLLEQAREARQGTGPGSPPPKKGCRTGRYERTGHRLQMQAVAAAFAGKER